MNDPETNKPAVRTNLRRCVAVDVHPHNFGFIVLEGLTVLDCGTRACEWTQSSNCLGQRFQRILRICGPSVVLMRIHRSRPSNGNADHLTLITAIKAAAVASHIAVVGLRSTAIRSFFASQQARTKDEIAAVVATFLPELAWKLPPRRKLWQSQHYRMSIFDAAAIALTYVVLQDDANASSASFDTADRSA